jgi:type II secretory pathway component PulM
MNLRRFFLYLLISSVTVSAVIGIAVILIGNFGEFETKILLTTTTITVTSILGLACGAYLETGRGRIMPLTGIGLAVVSAVMWMVVIWSWQETNDTFVKALMSATLLAASCSHLSLLSLARLDKRFAWSRIAAHAAVWTLAAIVLYLIWLTPPEPSEFIARITGVLGIIIASLTIVTPVFHKLSSHEPGIAAIDAEIAELKKRLVELEARRAHAATELDHTE